MAITAGSQILASDFVSTSAGAGDSGKVPKLNGSGLLDVSFILNYDFQEFTSSGTWTKPSGVKTNSIVYVELIGGGGAGGASGNNEGGAGGGGGGFYDCILKASYLGSTETVTIGAGGTGGSGNGGAGGNTTFGTWATAYGGGGGAQPGGGTAAGGGGGGGNGGTGGTGSTSTPGDGGAYGGATASQGTWWGERSYRWRVNGRCGTKRRRRRWWWDKCC